MWSTPTPVVFDVLQKKNSHKRKWVLHQSSCLCLPAALLLRTALLVYREAHTLARAVSNAPEVARATFGMLSYSPAPDIPARSSTLAVLLTITVASLPNALPACPSTLSTATTWCGAAGGRAGGGGWEGSGRGEGGGRGVLWSREMLWGWRRGVGGRLRGGGVEGEGLQDVWGGGRVGGRG